MKVISKALGLISIAPVHQVSAARRRAARTLQGQVVKDVEVGSMPSTDGSLPAIEFMSNVASKAPVGGAKSAKLPRDGLGGTGGGLGTCSTTTTPIPSNLNVVIQNRLNTTMSAGQIGGNVTYFSYLGHKAETYRWCDGCCTDTNLRL